MERTAAIILVSFIGLFTIFSLADGCTCNIEHPQARFCKAAFVFAGTVKFVERVELDDLTFVRYRVKYSPYQVYKGKNLLSVDRFNQTIYTPYYGSLCGRPNLEQNTKYLLSGSVEGGELTISYCNWIQEWDEITVTQRSYLRDSVYASNCATCQIPGTVRFEKYDQNLHSDYTNNLQMSGYWSMRECHYNPVASVYYGSNNCEGDLSYCSYDRTAGMCLWKWSEEYGKCFTERETLWQILTGAQPAYTNIRQCRGITNSKLKKRCKRISLKHKKAQKLRRRQQQQERAAAQAAAQAAAAEQELQLNLIGTVRPLGH